MFPQGIENPPGFSVFNYQHFVVYYVSSDSTLLCLLKHFLDTQDQKIWRNCFRPFACIICDQQTHEVTLIRDHLGLQPLYYWYQSGKLIFGETIPDVLKQLSRAPELNEVQIIQLFSNAPLYSDDTLYQGIYRVEPGHMVHVNAQGKVSKKAFWQLEPKGDILHYKKDEEYVEHFTELLNEAVQNATQGQAQVAAEFSAGMDSSAVCCAAFAQGIKPALFMHAALPGSDSVKCYKDHYEKVFLAHFQINNLQRIGADDFDALQVFREQAQLFAGAPPYIFYMFANNIHRAVAKQGHKILLSGFGGDQGVSGHAPLRYILPGVIKEWGYQAAWQILQAENTTENLKFGRKALTLLRYSHPVWNEIFSQAKDGQSKIKNLFKSSDTIISHPYFSLYFSSLRESEWAFLQGPLSHEIRMRIEYSTLVSKSMGFEYRYPLLYPKLLEFYLRLPPEQKRRDGAGRYLLRRYLAKQLPEQVFNVYKKRDGLDIFPATLTVFEKDYNAGKYMAEFADLPYSHLLKGEYQQLTMFYHVLAYMFKNYLQSLKY